MTTAAKSGKISCKKCGQDGLVWKMTEGGKWTLFMVDLDGNVNEVHDCKKASKAVAIVAPGEKIVARKKLSTAAPWFEVLAAIVDALKTEYVRTLLIGPPGTGKSTTALKLMDTEYRVTMTEGAGVEDLIGMFQLRDGATVWVDGPVVRAMREGVGVLIDEIDHHSTEVGSLLYGLMDDKPQIMLPTGEMIHAKTGYKVLATSNASVSALPEAILDRFEAVLLAIQPHPDALTHMTRPHAAAVENYFKGLDQKPWQWAGKPTLRRMSSFLRLNKHLPETVAANAAFGTSGKEILSALSTSAR
jgi:AAA domain (dynein-related subfamily)